jgi:hypothetical protein
MQQQIVLGLGAGQCGTMLLAQILNKQPHTKVTHEQPPLLPWVCKPGAPGIRERLERLRATNRARRIGDVASFYLPYVEEAIAFDPTIRLVCLKRPREEIVAGFCRFLDQHAPFPTNHWAKEPAPGWSHDPFWTHTFPQYDTPDRVEGIGRYWDEYYTRADELVRRFPEQFRVFDTGVLTGEDGVREVLTFAGVPREEQVVVTGQRPAQALTVPPAGGGVRTDSPAQGGTTNRLDPRRCAILVPFSGFIHQECDDALKELERRGYQVRRVGGYAAIDQGRNQMATDALRDGFAETLWIDSDVAFHPDSIEQLRSHGEPIVCGIYPQKGKRALACHVMPGAPSMTFGKHGGLVELLYAGTGFLLIRREVYLAVQRKLNLPMCNERFGHPMIPFFQPLIRPIEDGYWYLAEDYAFCHRARECGFRVLADTSIRLWHIGQYRYGWEDAGIDRQRFGAFTLNFGPPGAEGNGTPPIVIPALANLAAEYPWPDERPKVPPAPDRNWLFPATRELLSRSVTPKTQLVVEVGSWLGRSTRFLADLAPRGTVIAIDHWEGSPEHHKDGELAELLPRLYDTFLAECWDYRRRIIPLRAKSVEWLQRVAEAGLEPDVVYIDADHSFESVQHDLTTALDMFPRATIVGDDLNWDGVRKAVETVCRSRNLRHEAHGTAWRISRRRE